jgi:electron transport complex protein RnfB
MISETAIYAAVVLLALGAAFGVALAIAAKYLAVWRDPRVEEITGILPNANCGGCGFPGCSGYAEAVVEGKAKPGACGPGGCEVAKKIAAVLGVDAGDSVRRVAVLCCVGPTKEDRFQYYGLQDCRAANLMALQGGFRACMYGCLGLGTCARSCPFGAIVMSDKVPVVDIEKCTGCGTCVRICPRHLFKLQRVDRPVLVRCVSPLKGKEAMESCERGCITCRKCERTCPVKAISIVNDVAVIDPDKCTVCGKCVEACPRGTIVYALPKEKKEAAVPACGSSRTEG